MKLKIKMHRNSTRRLKLMQSRYNAQIFEISVAAKFLVSLTDRVPGLFSCLSYRKLTTENEPSQAKSLVNARDYLMELKTIWIVPLRTFCFLAVKGVETGGWRGRLARWTVSSCWRVVSKKKQFRASVKVWLFSGN